MINSSQMVKIISVEGIMCSGKSRLMTEIEPFFPNATFIRIDDWRTKYNTISIERDSLMKNELEEHLKSLDGIVFLESSGLGELLKRRGLRPYRKILVERNIQDVINDYLKRVENGIQVPFPCYFEYQHPEDVIMDMHSKIELRKSLYIYNCIINSDDPVDKKLSLIKKTIQ